MAGVSFTVRQQIMPTPASHLSPDLAQVYDVVRRMNRIAQRRLDSLLTRCRLERLEKDRTIDDPKLKIFAEIAPHFDFFDDKKKR